MVAAGVSASAVAASAPHPRVLACAAALSIALMLLAALSGNAWYGEAAVFTLIGAVLLPGLHRRRRGAWLAWLASALVLAWLGLCGHGGLALDAVPVLINLALCWLFARSLRHGREPLIARIIAVLEGRERLALPRVAAYARGLTWLWAATLAAQAGLLALVVACAVPDGALAALGLAAPIELPGSAWPTYLHFGSYALVPALLVLEYAFRRSHLRHLPHPSLPRFLASLLRCWPALVRDVAGEAARVEP